MGKLLLLVTLLGATDPVYQQASVETRRALLETKQVKSEIQNLNDNLEKSLNRAGVSKDELIYGAYVYPLIIGEITTKPFKNLKYTIKKDYVIRPEIEYRFRNDVGYDALLVFTKEF